jgi:phosphatidylglycerophosphate synthase
MIRDVSDQPSTEARPFGVGFLSVLVLAAGILEIISGVFLLTQRANESILSATDVTPSQITTYAVFTTMLGVIVFLVGLALRNRANWARYAVAGLAVVRLVSLVWVVVSYHSIHWYSAVWSLVIYAIIAGYLLFDEDARRYYAGARTS